MATTRTSRAGLDRRGGDGIPIFAMDEDGSGGGERGAGLAQFIEQAAVAHHGLVAARAHHQRHRNTVISAKGTHRPARWPGESAPPADR